MTCWCGKPLELVVMQGQLAWADEFGPEPDDHMPARCQSGHVYHVWKDAGYTIAAPAKQQR